MHLLAHRSGHILLYRRRGYIGCEVVSHERIPWRQITVWPVVQSTGEIHPHKHIVGHVGCGQVVAKRISRIKIMTVG